jgi:succinate dehydrogenase (ubiquinone) cytochrome b560 subunit
MQRELTDSVIFVYPPLQLTWILSSLNRITGVALSGLLYAAAMGFLLHPVFPAIDSAHLIELVAGEYSRGISPSFYEDLERLIRCSASASETILDPGLPGWLKVSLKTILAVPFTLHSFNGIRHLMWDMGYGQSTLPPTIHYHSHAPADRVSSGIYRIVA